tara:strand:+ start:51 stop:3332 length:3282 start_codon:yes stop_codon:yes gene_type:complete
MNNTVYIAGTNQPDIFHVGMTENNRDPEDRWKDSDYRAKMIYVPYKVAAFYTGKLRDEPVSKYILKDKNVYLLKEEINIRSDEIYRVDAENPAEYIKNLVKEAIEYYNSDCRERLAPFLPRFGQEDAIKEISDILLKKSNCLFSGYTGIGKTLIGLVSVLRYFNSRKKGGLVLVTTPIPDTLNSFIKGLKNIDVCENRNQKYSYMTKKEWENTSLQDVKKRTNNGEVIFLLLTTHDLFYDDKNPDSEIRKVYNNLTGKIDLWVRDEGHKFYRGERTSTLLDCLKASVILDLSATPYNFLDTYRQDTIVNRDLLWGSKHRKYTGLPEIAIESYETPFAGLSDNIKAAYDIEEGYDPRKWLVRDDNGAYIYIEDIVETYIRKYVDVLPKNKNYLNVNLSDKRVSLDVFPAGEDGDGAADKYPDLAKVLNQRIKTRHFIDAWSLKEMSDKTDLTLEDCVDKLLEKYPAVNILTCRKFTTGTDIPQMSHINLFDKISSPTELSQLIGRMIRLYEEKNQVALYNHCPGNQVELALGIAARKSSTLSGESQVEYLESIPFTKYPLNSTKPTVVTAEDIISQVQEYYRSISSPRPNTNALLNALSDVPPSFFNTIDLKKLGSHKTQISSKVKVSDPNKSKVKHIIPSGVGVNPTSDVISKVRELLTSIGIEMSWVSYTNKTYDPLEVLDTEEMKRMFDEYPLSIARSIIMNESVFKFFTRFLKEKKEAYNDRPFEEVHDYIFIDTDKKRKIGLVYVPMKLAYEMVLDKEIDKVYNNGGRNFLVENALSGSIAYVIAQKYPDANIFCAEYYSYFKEHLSNLAPNIVVDDISHDDLTYSLYEDMNFDVALSNPPYQSENKTGKKGTGGNNSLYIPMVKNTIDRVKDGGVVLQITPPAGIIKATEFGKPTKLLEKMIGEGSLVKIDLTIKDRYFSHIGSAICNWVFIKGGKQDKVEVISEKGTFVDDLEDLYYLGVSANKEFKKIEHEIYKKIISNKDGDLLEVVRGKRVRNKECTMARKGYPKIQKGGHNDPKQVLGFDGKFYDFMTCQLGLWLINYISRHDVMIYHNLLTGIKIPKNGFNLNEEEKLFIDSEKWLNFDKNG